jgi:hypothetical protein
MARGRLHPAAETRRAQIEDWISSDHPKLDGKPIELEPRERSRSLAVHPDAHRFVLGTSWSLYSFDAQGKE